MEAVPFIGIDRHRLGVDGVGVTTLAAFHGCPLRCKYCLNRRCLEPPEELTRESVERAAEVVGDFIVDIKESNAEIYKAYTGGDAALVWANLEWLIQKKGPEHVTVRVPLIPDFNTEADCDLTAARLKAMGATCIDRFTYRVQQS